MSHDILFLPGPTEVRPEVLAAMAKPLIGHRSAAMKDLVARIRRRLSPVFGTEGAVLFESCPATALMEAGLRNLVAKRALILTNGAFSERWAGIAAAAGVETETLAVPWGRAHDAADLEAALRSGRFDAVTVTHSETSTGILNPLPELAAVVRRFPDILLLVDVVSSLAGVPVDFDRNGLDFAFAGTQKCLAAPPGITVFALSERALGRAGSLARRGFLLDFPGALRSLDRGETLATPAIPQLFALDVQLDHILGEGLPARYARHTRMAERTRAWAGSRDFAMFGDTARLSPAVGTIVPRGETGGDVVARAAAAGFAVSNGYGQLRDRTFRIGHMGDHDEETLDRLLTAL